MNSSTKLFLVLLRVAIGWHFFYEGVYKIASDRAGSQPFTAQFYLQSAKGPAAPYFHALVPDGDALNRLTEEAATMALNERCQVLIDTYAFQDQLTIPATNGDATAATRTLELNQVQELRAERDRLKEAVRNIFNDPGFQQRLADYEVMLADYREKSANQSAPYSVERLLADEAKVANVRNQLVAELYQPLDQLDRRARLLRVRAGDQLDQMALGAPPRLPSQTYWIDLATMWGLAVIGFCLMVGLFPRLACVGAAGLLVMFYLAWPPWPGVPEPPVTEGHYLIVDKILIELLAVLVLLTVPSGRWAGLSAFMQYFLLDPLRHREAGPAPAGDARIAERLAPVPQTEQPSARLEKEGGLSL